MAENLSHPFGPVVDKDCRILILGSFPSVKSREQGFFYGHPQNRFWRMLSLIFHEEVPITIQAKKELLLRNHLAVWDVIASCEITGSSDASIRNAVPVDIARVMQTAQITRVLCNGALAGRLYQRYLLPITCIQPIILPSTSPANAAWSLTRLAEEWSKALK